ncbi:uncharacterized protein CTHT_0068520 [Thermochaetoides thermophila DSM 1495]|uniref:Thioesterase-like protein n=1 Tax=Chaetomium thermophilum (strain DSM 1495 / CBS 144.50 / IMI 039719) TaxID=759272 RepID=G0SH33_CHATD|nr:hypothetical protein CTHT_0068520 [Thermochaetoides thermophila DSM 1495]EGS17522.1 hypothetical protein CTHT_0068520 [Thermochaetoides thermophila DSM 1495]
MSALNTSSSRLLVSCRLLPRAASILSRLLVQKPQQPILPPPPPQRWISDLQARIGKCITFGCSASQVQQAAGVLRTIATEWRELLAGSEGFLTDGRGGLDGRGVAWGEMDSFGHVNNVNYYRYAETARVNWITHFAVHTDPTHGEEWKELMTPRSPLVYPDKISVYHKLRSKPLPDSQGNNPSSFVLDCIVLSHQHRRVSARLEEDIVVYDYRASTKTGMPRFVLDAFERTWQLQEQVALEARRRIWELIATVERLEKETWDRPDAVEDMGYAMKKMP